MHVGREILDISLPLSPSGINGVVGNKRGQNRNMGHADSVDGEGPALRKRIAVRQQSWIELTDGNCDEESKFGLEEESNEGNPSVEDIKNYTGLKWKFRDETWSNPNILYQPMLIAFSSNRKEPSQNYCSIPSFLSLFELFSISTILCAIVAETNRYVSSHSDEYGHIKEGP